MDYFESHEIRMPIKQPVCHGSSIRPFFFGGNRFAQLVKNGAGFSWLGAIFKRLKAEALEDKKARVQRNPAVLLI